VEGQKHPKKLGQIHRFIRKNRWFHQQKGGEIGGENDGC
jgi:hypothetical protein